MFLIVHASVGALVGEQIDSPLLAFVLGIFSHFIIDIIPHGDEGVGRTFVDGKQHSWLAALAFLDAATALCLVSLMWLHGLLPNYLSAFAGAVGAMVPDILSGIALLSKKKILPDFDRFHAWNHRLLGLEAPFWVGGLVQGMTLMAVWLTALVSRF